MNKFIPLLFGLMLPLAGAFADDFTDQAVEFCRSKGGSYSMGSMIEEGDNYCRQVTCKKTNAADGRLQIPDGEKGPEANVEATKRVCIKKSIIDGNFNTAGTGNSSGSQSGSQSGAQSGSQSGAQSGSQSGSQSGAQSGSQSGSQSGAQSGSGSGSGSGDGDITCTTSTGQVLAIGPYHHCYEACKASGIWPFRKKGLERKSCVECLMGIGYDFDASVKKKVGLVMVGGVSVTVCKDKNGNVVARDSVSGLCPNGNNIGFSGGSSGSGGIVISGGVGGGVGGSGGINWPEYCLSGKKKDEEKCHKWMLLNKRYVCSSGADVSICTGGANADIMARYDINNCVNCQAGSRQQSNLSGWAEIIGAAAPIVTGGLGAYFGYKSQKAWAGAAEAGFEQCQIDHNNYYQYLSANELPGLTPGQQQGMNCNGYSLGGYAGLQNPMLGGWYGAGYTPGMIGGMMGPYGGYNPYGGGYVGGVAGGYVGGMAGGYVGGISIAGGVAGGYPGGYAGGYVGGMAGGYPGGYAGGMAGGYPGGYAGGMAGGYVGGMAGGYPGGYAGGYTGGYAGGMAGGFVNGISIAGGYNGGFNGGYAGGYATGGGYAAGGYMAGGYTPGGYAGGYMAGGFNGGGYAAGGYAGGYAAGGYAGGGYAAGGYAGGMAGGYDYASSQQAANYDRMMQQQGTSFQMGMGGMGGGYTGGAFGAGGYPMNAGFGIQASLGGGFGF